MIQPQLPQQPLTVAAPPQPAPAPLVSPQVADALKKLADGVAGMGGAPGMPIDKNSPEYKQAMMQQLASSTPMGALGSVLKTGNDAYMKQQQQKQTDMAAWMPTVTVGE